MIFCLGSLAFDLCRLTFAFYNLRLDKLAVVHCKRRTSTRRSGGGCPKLFPISDNVSVVIQGVLEQHFRFFNK